MIISPPFLPVGAGNLVDVDAVMMGDRPGNGAYPVSFELGWHGGIHLDAPLDGSGAIPVLAIADGVIKYAGQCATDIDEGNPLYYYTGETSNGIIVIEHTTEIGEDVEVVFYSIYMHLIELKDGIAAGQKIYRKDELGKAGRIYGQPNKIHLEIVSDDANLKKLIGRNSGKLDISTDGRTDALWGEMYFAVPAGTALFDLNTDSLKKEARQADKIAHAADLAAQKARKAARAAPHNEALKQQAASAAEQAKIDHDTAKAAHALINQPPKKISDTDTLIFVGMRYEKGSCILTTYLEDGTVVSTRTEAGFEYELYGEATTRYPLCPSAGFELLRFGRVIGPDALQPADASHWRKIATSNGEGWIDLRPDAIKKFSDADFPHWRGWLLVDDDTNGDSRCDSALIKKIIVPDNTAQTSVVDYHAGLTDAAVQNTLQRTICKMPSIWSSQNLDQKWSWVKSSAAAEQSATLQTPMDDESFQRLKAHLEAQMFWDKAGLPNIDYWHFNPREFIRAFRQCGWLSLNEMKQMFPMTAMRFGKKSKNDVAAQWLSESVSIVGQPTTTIRDSRVSLNKTTRKFNIMTPHRMACFYGNTMQETQWFGKLYEKNSNAWYYPWDGRGFLQLTHPGNYFKYWEFLGKTFPAAIKSHLELASSKRNTHDLQDENNPQLTNDMIKQRERIENDQSGYLQADSAGAYWSWTNAASQADRETGNNLKSKPAEANTIYYYENESFGQVAATVNFGSPCKDSTSIAKVNGIVARYQAYTTAIMTLGDAQAFPDAANNAKLTPQGFRARRP